MENLIEKKQSAQTIFKSMAIAAGVAGVLLVCFILPAEYGIDPTGIGTSLGLTNLSVDTDTPIGGTGSNRHQVFAEAYRTVTKTITLEPLTGVEHKIALPKNTVVLYSWKAAAPIYFDMHGEPTTEEDQAFAPFKSYQTGIGASQSGSLTTEFAGTHGWYWRNGSNEPVIITVTVAGDIPQGAE